VLPVGTNTACFGKMSACTSVVPVSGANLRFEKAVDLDVVGGDADVFLDNCETGQLTFTVQANGTQPLTNVRVTSVTSDPGLSFTPATPIPIAASLPPCGEASATINFAAGSGLTFDQSIDVEIEITADEIFPQTRTLNYTITNVESSFVATATKTWSFESDLEGWKVAGGTFTRDNAAPGGAPPPAPLTFYVKSSSLADSICDRLQSPVIRLSATSTLSLYTAFQTEPTSPLGTCDRANVGLIDLDDPAQPRTTVSPSGGNVYTTTATTGGACVTTGQPGWNGSSAGYPAFTTASTWSAPSLNPGGAFTGKRAVIDYAYGTDGSASLDGVRFDHVTLTDFDLQVADTQDNECNGGGNLPPVALADAATTPEDQPVNIDVLENDSDPDGDPAPADTLTISAISDPPHGTATLNAGGPGPADDTIIYTPDICSFGTDVFTYTVTDPGSLSAQGTVSVNVITAGGACFKTVTPCRIFDSRDSDPLTSGTPRDIQIADLCGIPPSATAVSINVTVVGPTGLGHLKIYPGTTEPATSTINFGPGQTRANNAIVSVLGGVLRVKTFQVDGGTADVVIDVNGYTDLVPN
jgi:Bacterial Ig domain